MVKVVGNMVIPESVTLGVMKLNAELTYRPMQSKSHKNVPNKIMEVP